jgi:hypothetical protein
MKQALFILFLFLSSHVFAQHNYFIKDADHSGHVLYKNLDQAIILNFDPQGLVVVYTYVTDDPKMHNIIVEPGSGDASFPAKILNYLSHHKNWIHIDAPTNLTTDSAKLQGDFYLNLDFVYLAAKQKDGSYSLKVSLFNLGETVRTPQDIATLEKYMNNQ